jgi:hypothetical protein
MHLEPLMTGPLPSGSVGTALGPDTRPIPDTDMLKLVNAVQGTELAVAWHEINFHRIDEPAHTRPDPDGMVNYRPRSQARCRPDAPIDE